ncbi:MAG: hypothetical protein HPY81_07645 [Firmicutes bacterium]|nr:hypothetical protein [Bacillota bacterium]
MEKVLGQILDELKLMRHDLDSLKADVATLKNDVATLKTDVTTLKTDVATLKTDVTGLQAGQQEHAQILRALEHRAQENGARLTRLEEKVDSLQGEQAAFRKEVKEQLAEFKEDLLYVSKKVIQHEAKLMALGR